MVKQQVEQHDMEAPARCPVALVLAPTRYRDVAFAHALFGIIAAHHRLLSLDHPAHSQILLASYKPQQCHVCVLDILADIYLHTDDSCHRELAQQIQAAARPLKKLFGLSSLCIYGGVDKQQQVGCLA